jgi:hypothetical protein
MRKQNKYNKIKFWLKLLGIGCLCGFITNGVFWYYQQASIFTISINIVIAGFIAGLTGYIIGKFEVYIQNGVEKETQKNRNKRRSR